VRKVQLQRGLTPIGLIALGVLFAVGFFWLGIRIDWDLTATVGGGYRRGPAWLALPGTFLLGFGGIAVGILALVQERKERRRPKYRSPLILPPEDD